MTHSRSDAARNRIARILIEPPGTTALLAVPDSEPFERIANLGNRRPIEVFETDVVGNTHVLAELPLRESHERAMHRLRTHGFSAKPRAKLIARSRKGADADQIQADLDRLHDFERGEEADTAGSECRVREPVLRRER